MPYPAPDAESVFSLEILEPSPIEYSPYEEKAGYFPEDAAPEDAPPKLLPRATTLGLSGHGPAYYYPASPFVVSSFLGFFILAPRLFCHSLDVIYDFLGIECLSSSASLQTSAKWNPVSIGRFFLSRLHVFCSYYPTITDQPPVTRVQKYSSYAFSIFAAAHITNTALIPLATRSIAASDNYLLLTRPYYQDMPFEPLLVVAPLALHVGSGLALRFYRRRQTLKRYAGDSATFRERRSVPWPKLSGTSALGYLATTLVAGHAFANRVLPLWVEGSSAGIGLEYVSHAFARHPAIAFAGFSSLVGVAVWHSVWGWAKWLGWNPASVVQGGAEGLLRRKRRWYGINAVAAAVAGLWLWGGVGVVGQGGPATGWVAKDYDALFKSIPYFGQYL
ncbi:protein of unknown function DUF1691 [Macrophomina phaseolina MS6]|uniref:Mitochondrial adapter protein MCP1 transmembrane domain-containing protein n=1 Tax=Macrophomina phaseolina (strain MS6) TaxID=1126212 RepID=K2S4A4_MACPH|nr:protein of unknown function DUF1691 [Macrophomina phaseolina MS6]